MSAAASLGVLAVRLSARTAEYERQMAGAERTLTRFGNKAKMLGTEMRTMGRRMTLGLTVPLVGMAAASVKAFSSFDLAMTRSLAIMGDVSLEMRGRMAQAAEDMSVKWNVSASKVAESFYFLASAGLNAQQSLAALPQVMAFAKAGAFDLAEAVSLATDVQSAFGMKVKDPIQNLKNLTAITDKLVKVNTLADASTRQFAVAMASGAAAAAKNFNISMDETLAVLAAYAEQGIKAEEAGNMFSRMLRLTAKSIVDHKTELKAMGIDILTEEGNFRNLADVAGELGKALNHLSVEQKTAALASLGFQARVQQAIFPILHMQEELNAFQGALANASGFTKDVADKQMKAFAERLGQVWQQVQKSARAIGMDLLPVVEQLAGKLQKAATSFSNLTNSQRMNILKWAGLVAVAGPVLQVVGNATIAIAGLTSAFAKLGPVIAGIAGVSLGTVGAITGIGIAAVAAAFSLKGLVDAMGNLDDARQDATFIEDELNRVQDNMKDKFGTRNTSVLKNIRNAALEGREADLEYYSKTFPKAVEAARKMVEQLKYAEAKQAKKRDTTTEAKRLTDLATSPDVLKARADFAEQLSDSRIAQMDTESRINALLERHVALQEQITKAEGEDTIIQFKQKLLRIEERLLAAVKEKDQIEKGTKASRFAAAIEPDSLEAYRIKIEARTPAANNELQETAVAAKRGADAIEDVLMFLKGKREVEVEIA